MPSHMYILRCSNDTYYTGSTKFLEKRVAEHQVKKWSRKKKEALINGTYDKLPELAKKVFRVS